MNFVDLSFEILVLLTYSFKVTHKLSTFLLEVKVKPFNLLFEEGDLVFILRNDSFSKISYFSDKLFVLSSEIGDIFFVD